MSRYIDADALIAELQKDEAKFDKEAEYAKDDPSYTEGYSDAMWSRANGIRDAIIEIYDAPSIDIVRCKECRHWIGETEYYEDRKYKACWQLCGQYTNSEFWCKYGERESE